VSRRMRNTFTFLKKEGYSRDVIVYLSGTPLIQDTFSAIVCNGVGYGVRMTTNTQRQIAGKEEVNVFVYTHVKEDAIDLYGFLSEAERTLFTKLIDVDGVGPKTAIQIMDKGVSEIIHAVQTADVSFFQSIPRVGKKSAQKIIIDLKNKLGGKEDVDLSEPQGRAKEIVEALVSLGFSETESTKVTKQFDSESLKVEDGVKKAIQLLTSR
jgi:holliday junction DNA helicase RuvA